MSCRPGSFVYTTVEEIHNCELRAVNWEFVKPKTGFAELLSCQTLSTTRKDSTVLEQLGVHWEALSFQESSESGGSRDTGFAQTIVIY